jgi:hypothetical protein
MATYCRVAIVQWWARSVLISVSDDVRDRFRQQDNAKTSKYDANNHAGVVERKMKTENGDGHLGPRQFQTAA